MVKAERTYDVSDWYDKYRSESDQQPADSDRKSCCEEYPCELLAGEMEDQTTLRTKVNELAHELVTSLSPDFHSQKVIEMTFEDRKRSEKMGDRC
uniref:Uncharacterized protein n=1 Tax=Parascaris equorum TaxID=6256 RepID=A0A914S6Q0_PAREQ